MVFAMVRTPLQNRALKGGRAEKQVEEMQKSAGLVGSVGKVAVVTRRNAESGAKEKNDQQNPSRPRNVKLGNVPRNQQEA
jgi:hypothetical protein